MKTGCRHTMAMLALLLLAGAAAGQSLDHEAFFARLDLDRPDLAQVREAVEDGRHEAAVALWRDVVVQRLRERNFGQFGWHGYKGHPRSVTLTKHYCGTASEEDVTKWQPTLVGRDSTAARITQGNFEEPFPSLVYCSWQTDDRLYLNRAMELMTDFCATNQRTWTTGV